MLQKASSFVHQFVSPFSRSFAIALIVIKSFALRLLVIALGPNNGRSPIQLELAALRLFEEFTYPVCLSTKWY